MITSLYRNVLIRGYESGLRRRRTFGYLQALERTQWLSRAELDELQLAALRRLLEHTHDHCPYYRERWRALGLGPQSLQAAADFGRWPVIDSETVRQHRVAMQAGVPGLRLITKTTGGSGGMPLRFEFDQDSNDRRKAAWHRGYGWAGAGLGTKQVHLWGAALGQVPSWRRLKVALHDRLYRREMLSSYLLSEATTPEFLRRLNRARPHVIVAYTNPLYAFARSLREHGLTPHRPRAIVVGAEKLYDFQRDLIEAVFQAPVFETYGSREFMLLGAECDRHTGLHLTTEHILVEVLADDGRPTPDGEEGNVVVTDLYNYGMPFVRYANGDRAIAGWGACSCGRGLPLLKRVVGRRLDILTTPDGRMIPGELFLHVLRDFPSVQRFQVVQERSDQIELRMTLKGDRGKAEFSRLEKELKPVLGPSMSLVIVEVDEIPLTRAGKLQVVVNRTLWQGSAAPPSR
jgi:phenylacetate-CoA ligase